jgi:hypothetical protein
LTKSETITIHILLSGIDALGPSPGKAIDGAGCLKPSRPQSPREREKGVDFLTFLGCNPLKSLDSEK